MENHLKKYEKELEEIEMAVGGGSPIMQELLENYEQLINENEKLKREVYNLKLKNSEA